MYAVVKTGGKQYSVNPGSKILVERLTNEAGDSITFSEVLLVSDESGAAKIGKPTVSGASVTAKVVRHLRSKKIIGLKKRIKTGFMKKFGSRQDLTEIEIVKIIGA